MQTILTDVSKQRVDKQSQQQTLIHPFDMLVDDSSIFVADSCFLYKCNTSCANKVDSRQDIEERVETVCATDVIPESRTIFTQPYCLCRLSGTDFDNVGIMLVGDRKVRGPNCKWPVRTSVRGSHYRHCHGTNDVADRQASYRG